MRYSFTLLLLLFLGIYSGFAQNWQWADKISGTLDNVSRGVSVDTDGNVYVFAQIKGTVSVGTDVFITSGLSDALLVKFDADGNYQWGLQLGGSDQDQPKDIIIDDLNNIYVTGAFKGTAEFNPSSPGGAGELVNSDPDGLNRTDIFLAKYTSSGDFVWAYQVSTGAHDEIPRSISIDANNDILMVGDFNTEITFNLTGTISATGSSIDVFAAKIDQTGSPATVWYKHFPTVVNNGKFLSVNAAVNNNIYIGGYFEDKMYYETDSCVSVGSTDLVLFKLDTDGNVLWVRQGGGSSLDQINSVVSDKYENIYFTGYFSTTANFDVASAGAYDSDPLISKGSYDILLGKYNKTGNLQFVIGNGDTSIDNAYGLSIYRNFVEFSGYYSGTIIVNNDTLKSDLGNNDTGFLMYDTDGNPIEAHGMTGTLDDRGLSVVFDNEGSTFVTGYFQSDTLYVGSEILVNATDDLSPKRKDVFIAKYSFSFKITITDKQNVPCNGGSDGSATITSYFGTYPYTYDWSHDAGLNDSIATNLTAGSYGVKVTDANNYSDSVAFEITEPLAIAITGTVSNVQCNNGNDGAIDITVTGGTGTKTYLWSTSDGSGLNPTQEDQTGLTAGTYDVIVTDENDCTENEQFIVSEPQAITFGGSVVTDIITPPGSNGEIDLVVSGGTPAYSFSWTGPGGFTSTSEDITNLDDAGTYNLHLTDANNCIRDTSFLVSSNTAFLAFISDKQDIICWGTNTGSATVSTTGGTGPYTYAWRDALSNPVGGDDPTLSSVPAGTYYVTVTDNFDSRTADANVTLQELAQALTIALTDKFNVTCNGDEDGLINISVSGGWGAYTYAWVGPGGFSATSEDISSLGPGTYSVTVTDGSGCIATLTNIEITEPTPLSVSIQTNSQILCNGDLNGELEAMPVGGVPPYSYLWDDPGNQTTKIASFLEAGNYTVVVSDFNGCTAQDNQNIDEPSEIVITGQVNHISCGNTTGDIIATVSGGTPAYSYVWYDELSAIVGTSKDLLGQVAGTYTLEVTDANNCTGTYVDSILQLSNLEVVNIDTSNCSIRITATGGERPYQYSIDGGMIYQADSLFTNLNSGDYSVWVKDNTDCEVDGGITSLVGCNDPSELEIFSAFSPNDDTWNNVWNIPGILAYPNCVVKVFNSWGTAVFSSPVGYPDPWDGSLSGGKIAPAGTYYYVIDLGDGSEVLSGTVNIVK